jgi:hypothetical protein
LSDDGNPHYTGDTEINESNQIRTYMGLAFNETRIDVKIGYKLTINYNGATTHPDQTTGMLISIEFIMVRHMVCLNIMKPVRYLMYLAVVVYKRQATP